jgi:3-dehydroquinate dehydratase-2
MILLLNGPSLNLLGEREPSVYGTATLADVEAMVRDTCAPYGLEVKAIQSNYEGALIDFLQDHRRAARGAIVNPGALGHTSYALCDAVRAMGCPVVEVHISNIHAREEWRHRSLLSPVTRGQIVGLGTTGYYLAALWLCTELAGARREADPMEGGDPGGAGGG